MCKAGLPRRCLLPTGRQQGWPLPALPSSPNPQPRPLHPQTHLPQRCQPPPWWPPRQTQPSLLPPLQCSPPRLQCLPASRPPPPPPLWRSHLHHRCLWWKRSAPGAQEPGRGREASAQLAGYRRRLGRGCSLAMLAAWPAGRGPAVARTFTRVDSAAAWASPAPESRVHVES